MEEMKKETLTMAEGEIGDEIAEAASGGAGGMINKIQGNMNKVAGNMNKVTGNMNKVAGTGGISLNCIFGGQKNA